MNRKVTVRATLLLGPDVSIRLDLPLEVSLCCSDCRRMGRTVVMPEAEEARCTPTRHAHAARVVSKEVRLIGGRADLICQFTYDFQPFVDAKRGHEASDVPDWGRMSFTLGCPACGESTQRSTQTNLVRPLKFRCGCGYLLYTDDQVMPVFDEVQRLD